jgi:uncharacterized protein
MTDPQPTLSVPGTLSSESRPVSKGAVDPETDPRKPPFAWHYVLPFGVFMLFVWLGGHFGEEWFPFAYVARTIIVAAILFALWKFYTRVDWTHWKLGVVVGVVGIFQWVGMESLLIYIRHQFDKSTVLGWIIHNTSLVPVTETGFVIPEQITNPVWMWAFIAIRWMGASLVVPVMEELFWRDWLWRNLAAPSNFKLVKIGEYDKFAFWLIPVIFAFVHVQWLTAIVWALMIAWLLVKTKSVGACIIAHGVTNFLLGAYVLFMWQIGKPVWYFW